MKCPPLSMASDRMPVRWVIKIGSALITSGADGLNRSAIRHWCEQMAHLKSAGDELVLVSSGSIAEGMHRLGWQQRPASIHELQAAAAVGQMGLVQTYESALQQHGIGTAQILLTHADLSSRQRYLNARSTLSTLLQLGILPVVNENDTVTTDEIKLGDNDNLAALVANLITADKLIILTDQEGLFDRDPRLHPAATMVTDGQAGDPKLLEMAGPSKSAVGSGGMATKLLAAERAARSGTDTIIARGHEENVILRLRDGESIGTHLKAGTAKLDARKQWLANQLKVRGKLVLDDGAQRRLKAGAASLLPVGVRAVEGQFYRGELVSCIDQRGTEIARGLVNYTASEVRRLMGLHSSEIEQALGYVDEPELINRDNMVSL